MGLFDGCFGVLRCLLLFGLRSGWICLLVSIYFGVGCGVCLRAGGVCFLRDLL